MLLGLIILCSTWYGYYALSFYTLTSWRKMKLATSQT